MIRRWLVTVMGVVMILAASVSAARLGGLFAGAPLSWDWQVTSLGISTAAQVFLAWTLLRVRLEQ